MQGCQILLMLCSHPMASSGLQALLASVAEPHPYPIQ
jgi:hypothetical protein